MKYQDYLKLNEDDGGGDVGNVTANAETEIATGFANTTPFTMYSRLNMPQIPKEMKSQFHDDLKLKGYCVNTTKKKCDELTPTQHEYNDDKIKSISDSIADGSYIDEPILVSKDNKIVDGHHRWKAMVDTKQDSISTDVVNMSFDDLFNFLDNKTYVVKRDV